MALALLCLPWKRVVTSSKWLIRCNGAIFIPEHFEYVKLNVISSYRSWLERIRNERPAYLTITSLELPESPIPLIDSQASARSRGADESPRINSDRDVILDEFLEKVSRIGRDKEKETCSVRSCGIEDDAKKGARRRGTRIGCMQTTECNGNLPSLAECTKNIVEGPTRHAMRANSAQSAAFKDCICSEISENLHINIREKTEVTRSSRSPSPEVTHTIRIAMKYHGQPAERKSDGNEELVNAGQGDGHQDDPEKSGRDERHSANKNVRFREDGCCPGVNVALDFTLNCSSVQLTSRDISLRTAGTTNAKNKSE